MIIGTNFKLSSAKFLDDRQLCKDYATLIANAEGIIYPPGFEVFCEYENKYYQYVSDTNGGYIWEERKSGVSDGSTSASIKDDTISEEYTWSSAHIDSMRIDLETLITQANDYVDEIDERMLFIEGKFQWFEYFDGSYDSLKDKPVIPTKVSELENDSEFLGVERLELELENINEKIDTKIDKEEDRTLIPITELERLSTLGNYNDTEVRQLIDELETQAHTHINSDILNTITEEKINQWDNNTGVDDYNYIQNKPITRVGDDSDILLNFGQIIDEGMYIITAMVGEYKIHNELVHVKWADDDNVTLTIPNMFMVLNANRTDGVWNIINELHYGVDKENGKISDTLTIGEDKIILDKEGNGCFEGKVSQEGIPTEDKDLVTKGYVDNKFATNERIDVIDKENARRDVIIEALVNGRRRTVETDGNDVDLMFSTEKDKVWIDKIEGETLVNVCDQEEPIAITKSYTVEGTNHVPLQGEYDGKARPVVHGNTLVNHNVEYDKGVITGEKLDNTHGTEILNLKGTPGCEIKVDIDGHTGINLSTKKEDILCKSFDSASGNEINLVAEENSVSDLVIQGNTMMNLFKPLSNYTNSGSVGNGERLALFSIKANNDMLIKDKTYTVVIDFSIDSISEGTFGYVEGVYWEDSSAKHWISKDNIINYDNGVLTTTGVYRYLASVTFNVPPLYYDFHITIGSDSEGSATCTALNYGMFEGDLTQTPELIPTEYVEGLKSTFEDKLIPYSIYNGDNLTSITETQYQLPLTVKVGKTYTITTTANVGTTENHKYQYGVYSADGLTNYLEYESCSPTQTFVCDKANILFKVRMYPSYSGDDYSFVLNEVKDKFLIVEGDWTDRLHLLTDDYFGKYRVDMSSHGKNLFDKNNIIPSSVEGYVIPRESIKVKPNTTYTKSSARWVILYNSKGEQTILNENLTTFTTLNDTVVVSFNIENSLIDTFQLEEGSVATEYEPYHGSSKTVYLNSPLLNGDELLTKDGKLYHYHKMGMVVLDGSEDWYLMEVNNNTLRLKYKNTNVKPTNNDINAIYSDIFVSSTGVLQSSTDTENFDIESICLNASNDDLTPYIQIRISQSKLSTSDVNGFKQWLSENPTTVVYELAEPWYEPIGAYGKIVLDGSSDENWFSYLQASTTISYGGVAIEDMKEGRTTKIICDKFPSLNNGSNYDTSYTIEQCYPYTVNQHDSGVIYFHIFNSKLNSITETGFKQWFKENPVTVIYELANPQYIIEDMRFNIASTSTIEYQSNVPMANTQFLPYRNELPLLESSTQYRVTFDCDVEGIELMVSLGGTSQTITSALHNELSFITPSLQTDGKLSIDGYGIAKIDNVLITKGDMEYKYFEGLKSGFEDGYIPENLLQKTVNQFDATLGRSLNKQVSKATIIQPNTDKTFRYTKFDKQGIWIDNIDVADKITLIDLPNGEYFDCVVAALNADNENISYSSIEEFENKEIIILEGDWTHLTEEDLNNLGTYKATIRIQNPNAPIFGKGGRL